MGRRSGGGREVDELAQAHAHLRAHTHAHTHLRARTHAHARTRTYARVHTYLRAHVLTRARTRTRTHTHTRTSLSCRRDACPGPRPRPRPRPRPPGPACVRRPVLRRHCRCARRAVTDAAPACGNTGGGERRRAGKGGPHLAFVRSSSAWSSSSSTRPRFTLRVPSSSRLPRREQP